MKIVVNAGHCPEAGEPGACGAYSKEGDVTREVAKVVCKELSLEGHTTIFVQENELADICAVANDNEADVFVSIHCNAFNNEAHGTETFYYHYGDESYRLAGRVQNRLLQLLGTTDRGLKDGSWLYVINNTNMAATILTEIGFIDNPEEEVLINDNLESIGVAIADGILDYIQQDC